MCWLLGIGYKLPRQDRALRSPATRAVEEARHPDRVRPTPPVRPASSGRPGVLGPNAKKGQAAIAAWWNSRLYKLKDKP